MTPDDDGLDADLRALFADQRLSVPVGEDAVASVVAGAKRRRRRRGALLATGGALGVAVVLLAGGVFAGHVPPPGQTQTAHPDGLPITSATSPDPDQTGPRPAPEAASLPPDAPTVLGPTGYGDLTIGMTARQAQDTHLVNTPLTGVPGCTGYTYVAPTRSRPSAAAAAEAGGNTSLYVYLGGRAPSGVQVIVVPSGVRTPEGIGFGSSVAALRATYRNLSAQHGSVQLVPVPGHPGLSYRFTIDRGTVVSVGLGLTDQTCLTR